LVLVDHWRNLFFVNFHELGAERFLFAIPYILTAGGHQAVVVFFVLSGFLIGGTIHRAFERGEWSGASYLTQRLVRLWIVLVPGLLLCFLCDQIQVAFVASRGLIASATAQNDTLVDFVSNLFFLQGIVGPAFGSDGPLWSLANEFWYYILYPLALIAILPSTRPRARLIAAAAFLVLGLWLRTTVLRQFPLWLFGAGLINLPRLRLSNLLRRVAVVIYVPIVFGCTEFQGVLGIVSDYILAAATAILIWMLLSASQAASSTAVDVRLSRGLARFSYTLYVVHFPFLMLIAVFVVGNRRWQPTFVHIATGLAILVVTVVYAYAVASLTEFHTASVRRWVEQRLGVGTLRRAGDGP